MSVARRGFAGRHPIATGIAAGLVAGAVTGATDRLFSRLVSKEQKRRDRQVREAPAHQMAGPHLASLLAKRELSEKEKRQARAAFTVLYGIGWGLVYSGLRKRYPLLAKGMGLPFGIPFFFACDGAIAPLLKVSPALRKIPWQMSAKEMGNHVAWTATAELLHRIFARTR